MGIERRLHPRHPLILQVEYGELGGLDFTENLSEVGLFIRTDQKLAVGQRLSLRLSFAPLVPKLSLTCEVVRVRPAQGDEPAGVGVRVPDDCEEDRQKLSHLAAAATAHARRPIRILVVEDNVLLGRMFSDALQLSLEKTATVSVDFAKDGEEALVRLKRLPPITLVVTDLIMPRMNGVELLERMHADPQLKRTPAVVITSDSTPQLETRAVVAGASVILRKPVNIPDLISSVQALVTLATLAAVPGSP